MTTARTFNGLESHLSEQFGSLNWISPPNEPLGPKDGPVDTGNGPPIRQTQSSASQIGQSEPSPSQQPRILGLSRKEPSSFQEPRTLGRLRKEPYSSQKEKQLPELQKQPKSVLDRLGNPASIMSPELLKNNRLAARFPELCRRVLDTLDEYPDMKRHMATDYYDHPLGDQIWLMKYMRTVPHQKRGGYIWPLTTSNIGYERNPVTEALIFWKHSVGKLKLQLIGHKKQKSKIQKNRAKTINELKSLYNLKLSSHQLKGGKSRERDWSRDNKKNLVLLALHFGVDFCDFLKPSEAIPKPRTLKKRKKCVSSPKTAAVPGLVSLCKSNHQKENRKRRKISPKRDESLALQQGEHIPSGTQHTTPAQGLLELKHSSKKPHKPQIERNHLNKDTKYNESEINQLEHGSGRARYSGSTSTNTNKSKKTWKDENIQQKKSGALENKIVGLTQELKETKIHVQNLEKQLNIQKYQMESLKHETGKCEKDPNSMTDNTRLNNAGKPVDRFESPQKQRKIRGPPQCPETQVKELTSWLHHQNEYFASQISPESGLVPYVVAEKLCHAVNTYPEVFNSWLKGEKLEIALNNKFPHLVKAITDEQRRLALAGVQQLYLPNLKMSPDSPKHRRLNPILPSHPPQGRSAARISSHEPQIAATAPSLASALLNRLTHTVAQVSPSEVRNECVPRHSLMHGAVVTNVLSDEVVAIMQAQINSQNIVALIRAGKYNDAIEVASTSMALLKRMEDKM